MGKGSENASNYKGARVYYMEIANIHTMRQSHDALVDLCQNGSDARWYSQLEATGWLGHLRAVLSAANAIASKVNQEECRCGGGCGGCGGCGELDRASRQLLGMVTGHGGCGCLRRWTGWPSLPWSTAAMAGIGHRSW